MRDVLTWVLLAFGLLYVVALLLFLVGTNGWFGSEPDPLAGVFLIPLGMPWILAGEGIATVFGAWLLPVLGILAPLINVGLLFFARANAD
jgi:hypothetical protein